MAHKECRAEKNLVAESAWLESPGLVIELFGESSEHSESAPYAEVEGIHGFQYAGCTGLRAGQRAGRMESPRHRTTRQHVKKHCRGETALCEVNVSKENSSSGCWRGTKFSRQSRASQSGREAAEKSTTENLGKNLDFLGQPFESSFVARRAHAVQFGSYRTPGAGLAPRPVALTSHST